MNRVLIFFYCSLVSLSAFQIGLYNLLYVLNGIELHQIDCWPLRFPQKAKIYRLRGILAQKTDWLVHLSSLSRKDLLPLIKICNDQANNPFNAVTKVKCHLMANKQVFYDSLVVLKLQSSSGIVWFNRTDRQITGKNNSSLAIPNKTKKINKPFSKPERAY